MGRIKTDFIGLARNTMGFVLMRDAHTSSHVIHKKFYATSKSLCLLYYKT